MYKVIKSINHYDYLCLQCALLNLLVWSTQWQFNDNMNKCCCIWVKLNKVCEHHQCNETADLRLCCRLGYHICLKISSFMNIKHPIFYEHVNRMFADIIVNYLLSKHVFLLQMRIFFASLCLILAR